MEQAQLTQLIERSKAGDAQAQEDLLLGIQNRVYYHCKKMLKKEEDAQDATQEILISVLTNLEQVREPAAFWGWVNTITANRCKRMLTYGSREYQIPEDDEGNSLLDSMETLDDQTVPDKVLDNDETCNLVLGIIDELPPEQRMSVLFYYYDEMSVKDIAQAMEVSEGTVKSRLNYARKSIKAGVERLEKDGVKLYSVSLLPFLSYFLHMAAETELLSPAAGGVLVQQALAAVGSSTVIAGAAASGSAAGTGTLAGGASGTAAAGAAIGETAATGATTLGFLSTISGKIIAGIVAASLLVGGATVTVTQVIDHKSKAPVVELLSEPAIEIGSINIEDLPYVGDISQCTMTPEQANAFAEILEVMHTSPGRFCDAALFDVGDGIPAMWVIYGYDFSGSGDRSYYSPQISMIYTWDGESVQEWQLDPSAENYYVLGKALVEDHFEPQWWFGSSYSYVYSFERGQVGKESTHIFEGFAISQTECPTAEQTQAHAMEYGRTASYDISSFPENCFEKMDFPLSDEPDHSIWMIYAYDGRFLSQEEAKNLNLCWEFSTEEWKLGCGSRSSLDIGRTWAGPWENAATLAALLRAGAESSNQIITLGTINGNPWVLENCPYPVTASYDEERQMIRVTLDKADFPLELSYEFPVFSEETEGYAQINAEMMERCMAFFQSDEIQSAWESGLQESAEDGITYVCRERCIYPEQTKQVLSFGFQMEYGGTKGDETILKTRPPVTYNYARESGTPITLRQLYGEVGEDEIWDQIVKVVETTTGEAIWGTGVVGLEDIPFYVEKDGLRLFLERDLWDRDDYVTLPLPDGIKHIE